MNITNATEAAAWIADWHGRPRPGISKEVIRGLRMCASITRSAGNTLAAKGYTDAADLIEHTTATATCA